MSGAFRTDGGGARYFGVYPALVTDLVDPENLGRIELKVPWLGAEGENVRAWATLLTPYADNDQGFQMLPEVDSQVVVAFEAGSLQRPYIVGACWNGVASLPQAPEAANNKRVIKTRSGSILEFDDTEGAPKIAGGQVQIQANSTVEVTASAVNVHAATATFDGIVNCQTLIANVGVVSPSYTPGAGNIW